MKTFAFFMAILILALSVMPCADKGTVIFAAKAKIELAKSASQQSNPQQDDCSPFCHCACCAGFSINHSISSIILVPSYIAKAKAAYLSACPIEVTIPVWQPPKFC